MSTLTLEELDVVQSYIDMVVDYLDTIGLEIGVDDDMSNWKALLESAPATTGVAKTHDPDFNDLKPENAFWLYFQDKRGRRVACQADRLALSEDFILDYVGTYRLFGDRLPTIHCKRLQLENNLPVLRGRVNFGGGGWVHPDWRGYNLGGLVSRLGRAFSLRHFLFDYYVTFMVSSRRYGKVCGFQNCQQLMSGFYPGRTSGAKEITVDALWCDKDEAIEQMAYDALHPITLETTQLAKSA
jgi:hypothetical protein